MTKEFLDWKKEHTAATSKQTNIQCTYATIRTRNWSKLRYQIFLQGLSNTLPMSQWYVDFSKILFCHLVLLMTSSDI